MPSDGYSSRLCVCVCVCLLSHISAPIFIFNLLPIFYNYVIMCALVHSPNVHSYVIFVQLLMVALYDWV